MCKLHHPCNNKGSDEDDMDEFHSVVYMETAHGIIHHLVFTFIFLAFAAKQQCYYTRTIMRKFFRYRWVRSKLGHSTRHQIKVGQVTRKTIAKVGEGSFWERAPCCCCYEECAWIGSGKLQIPFLYWRMFTLVSLFGNCCRRSVAGNSDSARMNGD